MIQLHHPNQVVMEGHSVLNVPAKNEEDLCRWILSMPKKNRTILVIRRTDGNKELFSSIGQITSLRKHRRQYRKWLKEGWIGVASHSNGEVYLIISVHEGRDEFLECHF